MPRRTCLLAVLLAVLGLAAPAHADAAAAAKRPDLAAKGTPKAPSTLAAGSRLTVRLKARNAGRGAAKQSVVAFFLSRDAKRDRGDLKLGRAKLRKLKARGRRTVKAKLRLPAATAPGAYRLLACLDAKAKVRERSERNNCAAAKLTVTAAADGAPAGPPSPAPSAGASGSPAPGGTGDQPPAATPTPTPDPTVTPTPTPDTGGPHGDDPTPDAPPSTPTGIEDTADDLYTGAHPEQEGVEPGTIESRRVVVLSGRVLRADHGGLEGATVTVLGHPELGHTTTNAAGEYHLAANGGAALVIDVAAPGHLPAQRRVPTPWRQYVPVEDVMLLQRDAKATTVDPTAPDAPELSVVQGSEQVDGEGERTATLLFPKGADATVVKQGGQEVPLDGPITVRATEYTAAGQEAMPGELPPGTGYTYAADYSIDQADAAGATAVEFDEPVINYTENIIGAPVGSPVPTGSYDRASGRWKAERNGRVIEVVAEAGGAAQIDVDGDGTADTGEALDKLGVTPAELQRLAGLYAPGQELWRVRMGHFSPWDHNWPYGPPRGAKAPKLKFYDELSANPCLTGGSQIDCETQTLGEALPVSGEPFALHYRSDRVPGTIGDDELKIPITGSVLPPKLKTASIEVNIAGKWQTYVWTNHPGTSFPPLTANLTKTIRWDGKDMWGREVQGRPQAYVRVKYVYPQEYYPSSDDFEASFGQFPTTTEAFSFRRACGSGGPWDFECGVTLVSTATTSLGRWDAEGAARMGGWTLGVHHGYDPADGTLHRGDGSTVESRALGARLRVFAGGGANFPAAEGHQATEANLDYQGDMAVGADGTVITYTAGQFFGNQGDRLRRIDPDGTIHTFAGNGERGDAACDGGPALQRSIGATVAALALAPDGTAYFAGTGNDFPDGTICAVKDGRLVRVAGGPDATETEPGHPALQTRIGDPVDVAVGPDGLVYWAENPSSTNGYKGLVRRIGADGTVVTVAGGGTDDAAGEDLGDGELAVDHDLQRPRGIAWDADGDLYVAIVEGRVVRVDSSGRLTRFAGTGDYNAAIGWGKAAEEAPVGVPEAVAVAPDGTVYIRSRGDGGDRVLSVGADGAVQAVVGRACNADDTPTDGEAAGSRCLGTHARGLAVAPDGAVYMTDSRHWILRTQAALPGFGNDSIAIPSSDGTEVYDFSSSGRHRRTLDALTGAVLWSFGYDAAGRLNKVTDQSGRVTTIERGAGGRIGAIVAPGGQRTELETDADGWLATVRREGGATTTLRYGAGGLLEGLTDPRGGEHAFAYDGDGRLISDRNPTGFTKTLGRQNVTGGTKVTVQETGGAKTTYERRTEPSGDEVRVVTEPSGAVTRTVRTTAGETTQTRPDGTEITTTEASDPRWGNAAPYVARQVVKTPGGRTRTLESQRFADLAQRGDPMSVKSLVDRVTVNDRTTRKTYTAESRELETETPEGRRSTVTLDAKGRISAVQPDDGSEQLPTTYGYDDRGRLATSTQGTRVEKWEYDEHDRVAAHVSARGKRTEYRYDAAGRLATVTTPAGRVLTYGHDAEGRRTSVTLPGGALHQLSFTADGKDAGYDAPGDGGALTRDYDAARRLAATTLPSGRRLELGYDAGGRVAKEDFDAGGLRFGYGDAGDDRLKQLDRRTAADALVQRLAYGYDGGLVTSVTASGKAAGTYDYAYDDAHRLSSVRLRAAGQDVTTALERDDDGLLVKEGAFAIERDGPGGAPTRFDDGTQALALGYDTAGQLDSRALDVAGTRRYGLSLVRDADGRITKRTETVAGTATISTYDYDDEGRLTAVKRGGTEVERYAYDDHGNRTLRRVAGAGDETASFDARDRLTQRGGVVYTTDDDGFVTARGTTQLAYSARGELLKATAGGVEVTYAYDALNRRVSRTEAGKTERYLYGNPADPQLVTASIDGAGALTTYRYDDYGLLHAIERGGKTYAVAADQVGTPVAVFDADGKLVKRVQRDAWGVVTSDSNPGFALALGYAGGLEDARTGLVRFGYRDYDPAAGRWLARDPARFAGNTENLYEYAGSDPIDHRDPTGLICISGSAYSGLGGGGEICIDKKGVSACVEGGIGVGVSSLSLKSGGPAKHTGFSTVASAALKVGAFGVGDSIEIDPCGQTSFKIEAGAGPLKYAFGESTTEDGSYQFKDGVSASLDPSKWSLEKFASTEVKAEAKLAGKYCATTMDM
ncbi:MAG TPA: RHS repeat-associated core domain-containing protein [Solirubrobacteraceae bacterium]|jgi:RHS repeat-associated protein